MIARRGARGIALVVRAALAAMLVACGSEAPAVAVGRPVPAYAATPLTGGPGSLAELRGRVVLLNVWATWCVPCRTELPELQSLHVRYAPQGLALIGVSIDAGADADRVKEYAQARGVRYALWLDADDRISATFYAVGVPATYVIGRDGVLRWRRVGPLQRDEPELNTALQKALAEPGS